MNILAKSCLCRIKSGKSLWYITSVLREDRIQETILTLKQDQSSNKNVIVKSSEHKSFASAGILSIPTDIIINRMQVRFQKNYPRLHRDLEFPNFDPYRKNEFKDVRKTTWGSGDEKPGFTYVVGFFGLLCSFYGAKSELVHFVSSMSAAADVLALAAIEIDLSKISEGACVSYKWRGKPLFIKSRTAADITSEENTPMSSLKDPQTPDQRTVKPEWLIVIGICTHLGCVPIANSGDWPGGFYCPCHGSHYDNVGRIRKGPAPTNLEIPPYKFITDTLLLVG